MPPKGLKIKQEHQKYLDEVNQYLLKLSVVERQDAIEEMCRGICSLCFDLMENRECYCSEGW